MLCLQPTSQDASDARNRMNQKRSMDVVNGSEEPENVSQAFDHSVLLISSPHEGYAAGGLFQLDTSGVREIDRIGTHGISIHRGRFHRILNGGEEHDRPSDLLTYDQNGLLQ